MEQIRLLHPARWKGLLVGSGQLSIQQFVNRAPTCTLSLYRRGPRGI